MNSYRQLVGHTQANTLRRAKQQGRKLTPGAPQEQAWPRRRAQASSSMAPRVSAPLPVCRVPLHSPMETRGSPCLGTKDLALSGTGLILFHSGHSRL